MRVHGRTRRRPLNAFDADEKPVLIPAPTEPYDKPHWSQHTVDRSHPVVVGHALYSVPQRLGECVLKVRSDKTTVKLFLKGKLVKCHPPSAGGRHLPRPGGRVAPQGRSGDARRNSAV